MDDSEEEEEAPPVKAPAPKAKPAKEQYRPLSYFLFRRWYSS